MGAALSRRDQVNVAFLHAFAAFWQPQQGPVHSLFIARQTTNKGFIGQAQVFADRIDQIGAQAVFVMPFDFLAAGFVLKSSPTSPGHNTALALSTCLRRLTENLKLSKYLASGQKCTLVPVLRFTHRADDFKLTGFIAVAEGDAVFVTPSRRTRTSTRVDRALTTEIPTPCRPPENW